MQSGARREAMGDIPTPAHLSYKIDQLRDMPTLLLIAQSALASEYKEPAFWRACSLQVQRLLHEVSIKDLARFADAVAMSSFRDDELMYNVGDSAITQISEMDTDTLAVLLRSHALLRLRSDRVVTRLQAVLFEHMQQSRATASGLSLALLSLARLREAGLVAEPPRELLEAVGRIVAEHLGFFSVSQLCEVLEAYGIYRIQGDRQTAALLTAAGGALAREPRSLSARQCAAAVRAFAKCRVHDERLLTALASRLRDKDVRGSLSPPEIAGTLYGFAMFTCQDTALLDLLSIEARRCLHHMGVPLVSTVLASFAKAGISCLVLSNRAAVQLRRAPPEDLDVATTEELAALAMAFGKLQSRDEKLFQVLGDAFLRRKSPPLMQEDCKVLVHIVFAFTKVHVVHPKLFGVVAAVLLERFEELALRDLARYLHGMAKVEYLPPPRLQERILQALQAEQLVGLGVFELLKVAAAARRLGLQAPTLEAQMGAMLPHEAGGEPGAGPGRRRPKPGPKKRRHSARKRKWSW